MSVQLNIAEAKAKLSELVARAERGEEVILTRRGKPAVRLTPANAPDKADRPFLRAWGALAHLGPFSDKDWRALDEPAPGVSEMLRKWETETDD